MKNFENLTLYKSCKIDNFWKPYIIEKVVKLYFFFQCKVVKILQFYKLRILKFWNFTFKGMLKKD